MTKEEIDAMKTALAAYYKRVADFRMSHKPARCKECGKEISPGDDIWVVPCTDDEIYCCAEHLAYHAGAYVEFGDEDYDTWFERGDNT